MVTNSYGGVDYSDDPILPAWYVPGWTSQNMESTSYSQPAPSSISVFSNLPTEISYCIVTGSYNDGNGNQIGGYLTIQQSDDLLIQYPAGTYYRVPKRLVGNIPIGNILAWNFEGSGKVYLQWGFLNVIVMTNDQPNVTTMTVQEPYYKTQQAGWVQPATWVYHVEEFIGISSMKYDIIVPSDLSPGPVDINTLIVANTYEPNHNWNRGY